MTTGWLVIVATVSWGVWAFALRKAVSHMPPLAAQVVYALATVALVPIYLGLAKGWGVALRFPTAGIAWAVGAAALVGLGGISLMYAMGGSNTSSVVALTASYPVVTLVLAVLFLGEPLNWTRACGVVAIAVGAYLVSR
jgi:transporter family protein